MTAPQRVRLPAPFAGLFPGAPKKVEIEADTVARLIDALDARWPGMADCLRDSSPRIRKHINIFVAGQRVGLDHRLHPGGDVFIITAISGG